MNEITKTVRSLDADAYRVFRSKAVELGITTGEAMTEAMRLWVNAKSRPRVTVRAELEPLPEPSPPAAVQLPTTVQQSG